MLDKWDITREIFRNTDSVTTWLATHQQQTSILRLFDSVSAHEVLEKEETSFKTYPNLNSFVYPSQSISKDDSHVLSFTDVTPLCIWLETHLFTEKKLYSFAIELLQILKELSEKHIRHRPLTIEDICISITHQKPLVLAKEHPFFLEDQQPRYYDLRDHLHAIGMILIHIVSYKKDLDSFREQLSSAETYARVLSHSHSIRTLLLLFLKPREDSLTNIENQIINFSQKSENTNPEILRSEDSIVNVASIAHEFNTPLGICTAALSHLKDVIQKTESQMSRGLKKSDLDLFFKTVQTPLRMIENNIRKSTKLAEKFRHMNTKHYQIEDVHIRELVCDLFEEIQLQFPKNKNIELIQEAIGTNTIQSYPLEITQILTNLIMNSIHHGFQDQNTGKIKVRTTTSKTLLYIDYRDNGQGIAEENIEKIFRSSFTTGSSRGRTGLGLSLIKDIIEEGFHGSIECESKVGQGVHFMIKIPHPF